MLFSLVRGGLNLDCYWSGKQVAVCKNKTGRSRAQMAWGAPDMFPAHTNHCTLSPECLHCHGPVTFQAVSVTSSKARAEPQAIHLYSEAEVKSPILSLLPHSDGYKKKTPDGYCDQLQQFKTNTTTALMAPV